mgnify:CR=1 FL=1
MRSNPKPQEIYRHFKGNIYQIRCLAQHSETGEAMVVYQAMYDTFRIYVRPLAMFMEEVDHDRYPQAGQKYRFELLQDMDLSASAQPGGLQEPTVSIMPEAPVQEEVPAGSDEPVRLNVAEQTTESDEQVHIDPLVMEFLDADTYEQRLNILAALRHRITDEMINTMAVAVDLEIKDDDVEVRYEELKRCLLTLEKFECNRLR